MTENSRNEKNLAYEAQEKYSRSFPERRRVLREVDGVRKEKERLTAASHDPQFIN